MRRRDISSAGPRETLDQVEIPADLLVLFRNELLALLVLGVEALFALLFLELQQAFDLLVLHVELLLALSILVRELLGAFLFRDLAGGLELTFQNFNFVDGGMVVSCEFGAH